MMNRLHAFAIFLVLLGALCMSCIREAVMDAGEKPMVVVECVLSNNPVQTLYLRYTKGASKKEYEVVSEAEAVLYDLTEGTVAGSFVKSSDGVWTLDYAAIDDHEYRLEVNVPTYETITAEQKMPVRPWVKANRICGGNTMYWEHFSHDEWDKACEYLISENYTGSLWVYAMNCNRQTGCRKLADYICYDALAGSADDFNLTDVVYAPKIDTILYNKFMPENPLPCITGPYLKLRGKKMHEKYIRFETNPMAIIISGCFEGFYPVEFVSDESHQVLNDGVITAPADDQAYLVFATVSDDYEKYHFETRRFLEIQNSSQLSDIYLRDNVFTNINGGLGIFVAKAETKVVWSDSPMLEYLQQYQMFNL